MQQRRRLYDSLFPAVSLCALLSCAVMSLFVVLLTPRLLDSLFNTDLLHPQALLDDVVTRSAALTDWTLPPNPSLFPDGIIFLAAWSVSANFRISLVVYGVLALLLTFMSLRWMLSVTSSSSECASKAIRADLIQIVALLLLPILWELSPFHHNATNYFNVLLVPISHGSVFLLSIAAWCFATRAVHETARRWAAALSLVLLLGALSDRLVITAIGLPLLAVLGIHWARGVSKAQQLALLTALSLGAGELCLRVIERLMPLGPVPLPLGDSWAQTIVLSTTALHRDLIANPHLFVLCVFLSGWALTLLSKGRALFAESSDAYMAQVYLALCFSSSLLTPIVTGVYREGAVRYLVPGIACGLVGFCVGNGSSLRRHFCSVAIGLMMLAASTLAMGSTGGYFWYRPRVVRCLDLLAERFPTRVGVSDYWNSKRLSYLSNTGLDFLPLEKTGEFVTFAANRTWDSTKSAQVSFAVMDRLELRALRRRFGKSKEIATCGGSKVRVFERWQARHNEN